MNPDNDIAMRLMALMDRQIRTLELFMADAVEFMEKQGLLEEFVKWRMKKAGP